jgi:hypothetical protein
MSCVYAALFFFLLSEFYYSWDGVSKEGILFMVPVMSDADRRKSSNVVL